MHLLETNEGICRQCFTKLKNVQVVWSSSIIRLKEKNICSLRQGADVGWLLVHIFIHQVLFTKLKNVHSFSKMLKTNISVDLSEKGSTGKRLLMRQGADVGWLLVHIFIHQVLIVHS
jgi:hypothetical protein